MASPFIKKGGYFLVHFIWAFKVREMPTFVQYDQARSRDCLGDMGGACQGDHIIISMNYQGWDRQLMELGK